MDQWNEYNIEELDSLYKKKDGINWLNHQYYKYHYVTMLFFETSFNWI